jgi:uncharacterized SAM-binding protein YcdF (DUF218 family)
MLGPKRSFDIAKACCEVQPVDAIIVLGKNWDRKSLKTNNPELSIASKMNALAGIDLLYSGRCKQLIISGGTTSGYNESEYMYQYIYEILKVVNRWGFSTSLCQKIILENRSISTAQNMEFCKEIIETNNYKSVSICTVDFHLKRSIQLAKAYGLPVCQGIESNLIAFQCAISCQKLNYQISNLDRLFLEYSLDYNVREHFIEFIARTINILKPKGTLFAKSIHYLRSR